MCTFAACKSEIITVLWHLPALQIQVWFEQRIWYKYECIFMRAAHSDPFPEYSMEREKEDLACVGANSCHLRQPIQDSIQWQVTWGRSTLDEMKMALHLYGLPPKTRTPCSRLRQTSDKSQLRSKLQNHAWKHASYFQGHQKQEKSEKWSHPRGA